MLKTVDLLNNGAKIIFEGADLELDLINIKYG